MPRVKLDSFLQFLCQLYIWKHGVCNRPYDAILITWSAYLYYHANSTPTLTCCIHIPGYLQTPQLVYDRRGSCRRRRDIGLYSWAITTRCEKLHVLDKLIIQADKNLLSIIQNPYCFHSILPKQPKQKDD